MKIAFIAVKGIPMSGGIEKYTEIMAQYLSDFGHEVTVYTTRHYENVNGAYKNFKIKTMPSISGRFLEKMSLVFFASVDQLFCDYDVVHYHALGPSIFAFMARLRGRKIVIQSHGIEYKRAKWGRFASFVLKTLERLSYNMGDALTVVSKPIQQYFLETYRKESIYIPTGVSIPLPGEADRSVLSQFGLEQDGYYFFIARIVEEKGLHYLIDAFKRLDSNRKLVVAGKMDLTNPYHQQLKSMAENDDRIIFTGEVLGDQKEALFRGAFAFCLPSELEGMSIALLEAMSYKKLCIVSDIQENLDIAQGHSMIFHNKDCNDLFRVLNEAEHAQEELLNSYRTSALEYVTKNHDFQLIARQMEALYKSL